jgi:hypothetical protein
MPALLTRGSSSLNVGLKSAEKRRNVALLSLLCCALALSILAGRQLAADGILFVEESLLNPGWFPQPTPRRFFAVMWTTGAVRLLGLIDPTQIEFGSILFGIFGFLQVFLPTKLILRSRLEPTAKFLLLSLFLSGSLIASNFIVSESLFLLALTTIFVVYTLDHSSDPTFKRRAFVSFLLMASYEVVVISNALLLAGLLFGGKKDDAPSNHRGLTAILLACAAPFQIGWFLFNPHPSLEATSDPFIYQLAEILACMLLAAAIYFKAVNGNRYLQWLGIVLACVLPVALLMFPEMLHQRSKFYGFAYPSRGFTMAVTCTIALLPLLLNTEIITLPRRLLTRFGSSALKSTGFAVLASYCGVSLLASVDAYNFRTTFGHALSAISSTSSGELLEVPIEDCVFCSNPNAFGVIDPGARWSWPLYSAAWSMSHRLDAPVVLLGETYVNGLALAAVRVRRTERRYRSGGADNGPP